MSRRPFTPKVVTANALLEGDAVWLTADDRWTRDMAEAELIEDEAMAEDRLSVRHRSARPRGRRLPGRCESPANNGPEPTHFREAFRRKGPSNYAHGKQAQGL